MCSQKNSDTGAERLDHNMESPGEIDFNEASEHDRIAALKSHPPTSTDVEKIPYGTLYKETFDDDIGDIIEEKEKDLEYHRKANVKSRAKKKAKREEESGNLDTAIPHSQLVHPTRHAPIPDNHIERLAKATDTPPGNDLPPTNPAQKSLNPLATSADLPPLDKPPNAVNRTLDSPGVPVGRPPNLGAAKQLNDPNDVGNMEALPDSTDEEITDFIKESEASMYGINP